MPAPHTYTVRTSDMHTKTPVIHWPYTTPKPRPKDMTAADLATILGQLADAWRAYGWANESAQADNMADVLDASARRLAEIAADEAAIDAYADTQNDTETVPEWVAIQDANQDAENTNAANPENWPPHLIGQAF